MTPEPKLTDLSLAAFAEKLAARTPTPGGGSVAAYLAAVGAALVSMACRFTSGEKYAQVEGAMAERARGLDAIRGQALELVDRDSRAYDAVTAGFGLPKTSESEKSARAAAVQAALRTAMEVPFETMQQALGALRLAAQAVDDVNRNLASDCAVGATCLADALEGAFYNVRINAASIKDASYVAARLSSCESMRAEARELSERVRRGIEKHLS